MCIFFLIDLLRRQFVLSSIKKIVVLLVIVFVSRLVLRLVGVLSLSLCRILNRMIVVRLVASVCCLFVVFVKFVELVCCCLRVSSGVLCDCGIGVVCWIGFCCCFCVSSGVLCDCGISVTSGNAFLSCFFLCSWSVLW